jgi:hypothetical protein
MAEEILIGVGATDAQMLAFKVLEWSLRKHSSRPLRVVPLHRCGLEVPRPEDPANLPRTPFSFHRFLLPELAGFRGRAIYLDSDMLVFSDIGELFETPMDGATALAAEPTPGKWLSYSVLLIDCGCGWRIGDILGRLDRGEVSYEELMFELKGLGRVETRLPYHWNSLDTYAPGETRLIHYTTMQRQPWLMRNNRHADVWIAALLEALEEGVVEVAEVEDAVEGRWVRPSLLYQVRKGVADPRKVPPWITFRDRPFTRYCRDRKFKIF